MEIEGLNTLSFIQANSLTYTEIQNDINAFIDGLSEDEKLGFKTLFEGTNSQILIELVSAAMSDELYHIITSRSENLLYYLNRKDSATAISQNYGYSTYRGSNVHIQVTMTPNQTAQIKAFDSVGIAEDYNLIVTEDIDFAEGQQVTFDAYLGVVKQQSITADTEDLLVFRFTNQNISEQIQLSLNGKIVPHTGDILDMVKDKYFCITNAYSGVDAIYLNKRKDFTNRYGNGSVLTIKYIEFQDIKLNSVDIECLYGDIDSVVQLSSTIQPESVASVRTKAPLYAETQNRIVARDDFATVFQSTNPEIADAVGEDYSNAQVEITYVKYDGTLLTPIQYKAAYDNLLGRRAYGIPMCLLSHPDVMLGLDVDVIVQLIYGTSAQIPEYIRKTLSNYELQLGATIDFSAIEHAIEDYAFIKTARIVPKVREWSSNTIVREGTVFEPTEPDGKLYVVRNPLFLTGLEEPEWNKAYGQITIDNDIQWKCEPLSVVAYPKWKPETAKRLESIVTPTDEIDCQFRCVGFTYKSGATEPEWSDTLGSFTTDNQILWQAVEKDITAPEWNPNTIYNKSTVVNNVISEDVESSKYSFQAINYLPRTPDTEPNWNPSETSFIDKNIQYAVINKEYDPTKVDESNIKLAWNQYVRFNESIQVVS